jgi:hypothetical protein
VGEVTRPTDEEIEKWADQYEAIAQDDAYRVQDHWVSGFKTAIANYRGLDWKRPEEELPAEVDYDLMIICCPIPEVQQLKAAIFYQNTFAIDCNGRYQNIPTCQVKAWGKPKFPEWCK